MVSLQKVSRFLPRSINSSPLIKIKIYFFTKKLFKEHPLNRFVQDYSRAIEYILRKKIQTKIVVNSLPHC